ncbi:hypothetical protein FIU87_16625 [Bacillus sp. THAF10]|uniref:hypothetical protein n=1 Tax=Bacillus sp. THAF10 TaxID=2587848 RepID=UPI001267F1E0|nr:hypothetical protein [Bacillus sp. THAF10]QFT90291.1 hypothetical protein FIU87_16625 [Bacillus sp. THAF10]
MRLERRKFISGMDAVISGKSHLSAQTLRLSAEIPIYQPKRCGYQREFPFISQNECFISRSILVGKLRPSTPALKTESSQ